MAAVAKKTTKKKKKVVTPPPPGRLAMPEEVEAAETEKAAEKVTPQGDVVVLSRGDLRKYFIIAGLLLLIVLLGLLTWKYLDTKKEVERLSDPEKSVQQANQEVISEVEKIFIVPKDEQADVREIGEGKDKLQAPFFAKAETGDKVLVYQKSSLVILYRPSTKQIVNVATIDSNNASTTPSQPQQTQAAPAAQPTPQPAQ